MEHLANLEALRRFCRDTPRPLGLVPTMGSLHAGHLSLLRQAREDCATVVATLFVNPSQFGDQADYDDYPKDFEADRSVFQDAGVDAIFAPEVREMYPDGFSTSVQVGGPALSLEGAARPGHFDGVATVVAKQLIVAGADLAYFGRKDGQQLAVVRRVVSDLGIATQVIAVPTIREPDGLALSSRNALLTPGQRTAAPVLYRALQAGARRHAEGSRDRAAIVGASRDMLEAALAADEITVVDYVALVVPDTMAPWSAGLGMLAAAVRIGRVRLIDNVLLDDAPA